jgi:hypothetical protein
MTAVATVAALIARTLPARIRSRYREEWLADLDGAAELGMARSSVIGGAIVTAAMIDRGDPAVSGMPRSALAARHARWAAGLLGGAVVLGVGLFFWGGFRGLADQGMVGGAALAVVGSVLQVICVVLVVAGSVTALAAGLLARAAYGRRATLVAIIGAPIGLVAIILMMLVMPLLGLLGAVVGVAVLVAVSASEPGARDEAGRAPRTRRALLAVPWSLLTLAAVATGVLHITVWNPLARVPGLSLDEIYAAMAAADQGTGAPMIAAWAIFWSLAAIALPVVCAIPRLARVLTGRRILVLGLLMLGMTVFFQWFAGFGMGMNMADTFVTTGGDAAATGPALTIVGMLALVGAILIGLAPARRSEPESA